MRSTLKLLLLLAIGLASAKHGGDAPGTPGDSNNGGDSTPGGDSNDSERVSTPGGTNAATDWGAAETEIEKELDEGVVGNGTNNTDTAAAENDEQTNLDRTTEQPVGTDPHPEGVPDDWTSRVADNGKGTVYQDPGSNGNADMLRVMDPTPMYPNGYVRFYNEHGQPIGLDGKPGSKAATHIPMNPDGTFDLPQGWGE